MSKATMVSLAAAALSTVAYCQAPAAPKPILFPSSTSMKRVEPAFLQPIMKVGNVTIPLGPKVPYHPHGVNSRRVGALIFDAFEGNSTNNMNPDVPTDGLYGETELPGSPGNRWYFGNDFYDPFSITHYLSIFPGTAGKAATGFDFLLYVDAATAMDPSPQSVSIVNVFMSGDPFNPSSPTPPTNFLTGVQLTYSTAITPGSAIYSNVDLTTSQLAMPTTTNGWFALQFGTGLDGNGNTIECPNAQPLFWGTKPLNPSQVDQYEYVDGDLSTLGSQTGSASNLFTFQQGTYGIVSAYTVTRGVETSTHNVANLTNTPGSNVVVSQRLQPILSAANAEVTATVQLQNPSSDIPNLTLLRGVVVAKANALPLNGAGASMVMSMLNNTTNAYDVVRTITPIINAGSDGTLIIASSIAQGSISKYINTNNNPPTVSLRFGVKQPKPVLIGWNLTLNYMSVDACTIGPDPLCPSLAFSTTN